MESTQQVGERLNSMLERMQIVRYSSEKRQEWDAFVKESKNGTFLFLRDYMDYHADRFKDHSLMFFDDKNKLVALLPANERDGVLYSHQGLTYGGFILSIKAHITEVGDMFALTLDYLKKNGFTEWRYKLIPSVYHRLPSQEDQYWLWRNGAEMVACNMMTAIDLRAEQECVSSRKQSYANKLIREGYAVTNSTSIEQFWPILEDNLQDRFESRPVHTLDEITMLQGSFPENILCRAVVAPNGQIVAGTLLFVTDTVVRTQYISASPEGKACHALDLLFLSLAQEYRNQGFHYFDFGTSMAEDGIFLNDGLIMQKELLGGRTIACPTYTINLNC